MPAVGPKLKKLLAVVFGLFALLLREFGLSLRNHVYGVGSGTDVPELLLPVDVHAPPRPRVAHRCAGRRLRHCPHVEHPEPAQQTSDESGLRTVHRRRFGVDFGHSADEDVHPADRIHYPQRRLLGASSLPWSPFGCLSFTGSPAGGSSGKSASVGPQWPEPLPAAWPCFTRWTPVTGAWKAPKKRQTVLLPIPRPNQHW